MSGSVSYHAGLSAEEQVAARYSRAGHRVLSRRWRCSAGEIDLVVEKGGEVVFVEVKSSRTLARAAQSLGRRQIARLQRAAACFLGYLALGQLSPTRFDVALVDGFGQIEIISNALVA